MVTYLDEALTSCSRLLLLADSLLSSFDVLDVDLDIQLFLVFLQVGAAGTDNVSDVVARDLELDAL